MKLSNQDIASNIVMPSSRVIYYKTFLYTGNDILYWCISGECVSGVVKKCVESVQFDVRDSISNFVDLFDDIR